MRSIILGLLAGAGLVVATSALPADMPELAVMLKCNACHSIDRKIVGPAWMDISRAYNSNGTTSTGKKVSDFLEGKTAEQYLQIKISEGGAGNWGTMPMPINDTDGVYQAEIGELVKFILGLAKENTSIISAPAPAVDIPKAQAVVSPKARAAANKASLLTLAKKYKCDACHTMDKSWIGPSWMEISKAYNSKGTTRTGKSIPEILRFFTAEKLLLLNVSQGSKGNWGSNLMPANDPDYKNEAGISKLIKLILELAS